ncbi:MAG: rhomboid family intramembrane serine protease [Bacteroidota bacterium]|nr:rhomboid family intramembrane serine protease [Bacteroidota bacterium]
MYQQNGLSGFSNMPTVVKNLLIINALCFFAHYVLVQTGKADINHILGLYYPESKLFKPYQILTHVFMHGDFWHLFFNMFSLWMFGSKLESYWGPKRFFIYYFVTAFGAAALYLGINAIEINKIKSAIEVFAQNPDYDSFYLLIQKDNLYANASQIADFLAAWNLDKTNPLYVNDAKQIAQMMLESKMSVPVVGASGAVFGLLLGFGLLFPNTELLIMFIPVPVKAKYVVIGLGLWELYSGLRNNPADNIAHFAHLGGMLFGYILIKYWNQTNRRSMY